MLPGSVQTITPWSFVDKIIYMVLVGILFMIVYVVAMMPDDESEENENEKID